jgi:hypothetical protein
LELLKCRSLRRSLGKSEIGQRGFASFDRWQSLGCPDPEVVLLERSLEEWVPEFEAFLDSVSQSLMDVHEVMEAEKGEPKGAARISLAKVVQLAEVLKAQ